MGEPRTQILDLVDVGSFGGFKSFNHIIKSLYERRDSINFGDEYWFIIRPVGVLATIAHGSARNLLSS